MIRIAIVDDEEIICTRVKRLLESYSRNKGILLEIDTYQNEKMFISDLKYEMHFDLLFLDIELSDLTGIQVGHWIREQLKNEWMQIVYISGKDGYDRQLFSVNCLDFLSKPISLSEISRVMDRFITLENRPGDVFIYQKNHVSKRIFVSKILYFESVNRKIVMITSTERIEFYDKLDEIEKSLPVQFLRIHKSYLVNYQHIQQFQYEKVVMSNNELLIGSTS